MKKSQRFLYVVSAIFVLSGLIASYLVYHHYQIVNGEAGFGSFCSINTTFDCDAVNASKYSEFLGVPLGVFQLGFSLVGLIAALLGALNAYWLRDALFGLFAMSGLSVVVSLAMFSISAFALRKVCLLCSSIQLLNLLTFSLLLLGLRASFPISSWATEGTLCKRKRLFGLGALGITLTVVLALATSSLKGEPQFDRLAFETEFRAQPPQKIDLADSPKQGFLGSNPPLTLIEFADFQCGGCAYAAKRMHHLIRKYEDKVQLVFKHFPLDPACNRGINHAVHPYACLAARAAVCAQAQGKFIDYYEKLFMERAHMDRQKMLDWAREAGMDATLFATCLDSEATIARVKQDVEAGLQAGVDSTPSFFANGKLTRGPITEEKLKAIFEELGIR